jgi:hypothetical protein
MDLATTTVLYTAATTAAGYGCYWLLSVAVTMFLLHACYCCSGPLDACSGCSVPAACLSRLQCSCCMPVTVAVFLLYTCYVFSVPAACLSRLQCPAACLSRLQCSCCMPVTVAVFLLHACHGCVVPAVHSHDCSVLLRVCHGCRIPATCLFRHSFLATSCYWLGSIWESNWHHLLPFMLTSNMSNGHFPTFFY